MINKTSPIFIVLFNFNFDLLSIFMEMTNTKNIEIKNRKNVSIKNICIPTKLSLIHRISIWLRPRVYIKYCQPF